MSTDSDHVNNYETLLAEKIASLNHVNTHSQPGNKMLSSTTTLPMNGKPIAALTGYSNNEIPKIPQELFEAFPQFKRKEIQLLAAAFFRYDDDADGMVEFMSLKLLMETLGEAQFHLRMKEHLHEMDKDHCGKLSFREFLHVFRLVTNRNCATFSVFFEKLADFIDVAAVGVKEAARFFEAKANETFGRPSTSQAELERLEEIREKQKLEEEAKKKKAAFQERLKRFQ